MKKILALILALMMLSGCAGRTTDVVTGDEVPAETEHEAKHRFAGDAVALVTVLEGMDDEPLAVSAWQAVESWCQEHRMERAVYETPEDSQDARVVEVARAIADGAETVVLPGVEFAPVLETVREVYPHIRFISLEAELEGMENLASLTFDVEQGCFLLGDAAVRAGYRNLGLPQQMDKFVAAFRRGAEAAAAELAAEVTFTMDRAEAEVFFENGEVTGADGVRMTIQEQPREAVLEILNNWTDYVGKNTLITGEIHTEP